MLSSILSTRGQGFPDLSLPSGMNANEVSVATIFVFMCVVCVHVVCSHVDISVVTCVDMSSLIALCFIYCGRDSHLNSEHTESVSLASCLALGKLPSLPPKHYKYRQA